MGTDTIDTVSEGVATSIGEHIPTIGSAMGPLALIIDIFSALNNDFQREELRRARQEAMDKKTGIAMTQTRCTVTPGRGSMPIVDVYSVLEWTPVMNKKSEWER